MTRAAAVALARALAACAAAGVVATAATPAAAAAPAAGLQSCRLPGIEHGAWCGHVARPLDPARPGRLQIDVHFAVLPAVARNKKPDPVFFFAGGPGQSAIDLASSIGPLLARFGNRRDIVLIDQRGTGRSAPLRCDDDASPRSLAETGDLALRVQEVQRCRERLARLPYGDLRQFTTVIATQDADAVRRRLGAERINIVAVSYGTRAALDYMRQFPQAVRRAVLDGVAPPDMALPAASSQDVQAALDALLRSCEQDAACRAVFPQLRAQWRALLAGLPRRVTLPGPLQPGDEELLLTRELLLAMVRMPLYVPALAAGLPAAIAQAADGRFAPLSGLAAAVAGRRQQAPAQGMHLSVVCSEDLPLLDAAADVPGADVGTGIADLYRRMCTDWPRGTVPPAFYTVPPAPAATLLLSGGINPATPPRHGERVARALGSGARHVVVPNAGHGLLGIVCIRDLLFHFIDAATDAQALQLDAGCAAGIPRPPAYVPVADGMPR